MRIDSFAAFLVTAFFAIALLALPLSYQLPQFIQYDLLAIIAFIFFLLRFLDATVRHKPLFCLNWFSGAFLIFIVYVFLQYVCFKFGLKAFWIPSTADAYATRVQFVRLFSYWILLQCFQEYGVSRKQVKLILAVIFISAYCASLLSLFRLFSTAEFNQIAGKIFSVFNTFPAIHANRNNVASFLELVTPLALGMCFYRLFRFIGEGNLGKNQAFFIFRDGWFLSSFFLLIVIFSASLGTLSRFGLIAQTVGIVSFLIFSLPNHQKKWAIFIVIIFLMFGLLSTHWLAGKELQQRFGATRFEQYATLNSRIPFWHRAWPLFLMSPWCGTGLGTFSSAFVSFHRVDESYFSLHLLNDYLELLTETGIVGFSIVLIGLAGFIFLQIRSLSQTESHFRKYIGFGLLCGGLGFLTHELVISNFYDHANLFYLLSFISLSAVVLKEEKPLDRPDCGNAAGKGKSAAWNLSIKLTVSMLAVAALYFFVISQTAKIYANHKTDATALLQAASIDGDNADDLFGRAIILKQAGDGAGVSQEQAVKKYEQSLQSMRQAITRNKFNLLYRTAYSDLAFKLRKYEEGDLNYRELQQLIPFDAELLLARALYYFRWAGEPGGSVQQEALIQKGIGIYKNAYQLNPPFIKPVARRKLLSFPPSLRQIIEQKLVLVEA